jgi:PGF-CTERM protein
MTRTSTRLACVGIALLLVAAALSPLGGLTGTATAADNSFVVEQGGQCYEIDPLAGSQDVVSLYDYRNIENTGGSDQYTYSSYMPRHLQQADTSRLFLYDGPGGVSLVIVHNELNAGTPGSAATFQFSGLPSSGSWVVQDDNYAGQDDRFSRNRIDWIWYEDRTDGAVFRDVDREGTEITIYPAFDEQAALYEPYDRTGTTRAWQFLTGSLSSPGAVGLDMSRPVTVRTGTCGPDETPPSAALSAGNGVVGQSITFDARRSSDDRGVAEYRWDFDGDGTVDRVTTDPTTAYDYAGNGTYSATVTVVDEAGNADAASASVAVEPDDPPSATVAVSDSPTAGFPVSLDASGSGDDVGVTEYRWDFDGDGGTDRTTASPTVARTYDEAGRYEVELTVVDTGGNDATATRTVEVGEDDPPEATFVVESPETPVEGQQVVFDASNATDDTGIAAYQWEFGDDATATGERVAHTFAGNGTYEVTLEVVDGGGNDATETMDVEVLPPDETPPEAGANATPETVEAGAPVTFDASDSADDRAIESYYWDLGDGTTASGETANHTYGAADTYDATVTVTDGGGNADAANVTVEVRPARPPNVSASVPDNVTVGESFPVEASATDGSSDVVSYEWDFAGTAATGQAATHAFNQTGTYIVTVTAVDAAGQANATSQEVTVVEDERALPGNGTDGGDDGGGDDGGENDGGENDGGEGDGSEGDGGEDRGDGQNGTVQNGDDDDTAGGGGLTDVGQPAVDTGVERRGANAAVVDVRNARADEPIRTDLPKTDLAAETGVAFRSVAVNLSEDDAHVAIETARGPVESEGEGDATRAVPADVTLGTLAVEGKYVEAEQVEDVTYDVAVQQSRLDEANLAPADLTAYTYQPAGESAAADDGWQEVTVTVEERGETVVLLVEADGLAPVAVGGERRVSVTDAELAAENVAADEPVSVTATLANDGDEAAEFAANLTADGEVVATETVEVPAGESRAVSFSETLSPGTYEVGLDGERVAGQEVGSVTVAESAAELSVADVSVNESAVAAGEQVAVTATVENPGSQAVSESVELTMFGEQVATRTVEVSGGETRTVTFVRQIDAPGTFTAKVGGEAAEVEVTEHDSDDDSPSAPGVPIPGFGVGAAVVALVAAALLARLQK